MSRDIVEEILLGLPPPSLARCKLLSKEWHDCISRNASFRERYLSRNKARNFLLLGLFFCEDNNQSPAPEPVLFVPTSVYGKSLTVSPSKRKRNWKSGAATVLQRLSLPVDESLSFLGQPPVRVLGSSNGFLLCMLGSWLRGNYRICNPITRKIFALPPPNGRSLFVNHGFLCHAMYQKVVRVVPWGMTGVFAKALIFEIFPSDDPHRWKLMAIALPFPLQVLRGPIILTQQNYIYMPVTLPNQNNSLFILDVTKQKGHGYILSFPAQSNSDYGFCCYCLGQSDGKILYGHYERGEIRIWELNESKKDNGRSAWKWGLKHEGCLEMTVGRYREERVSRLIAFHPMNPRILFIATIDHKIFLFDTSCSKSELVYDVGKQGFKNGFRYNYFPYSYGLIGPHLFYEA